MSLGQVVPVIRIFDEAKAKEFYIDFLGFKLDWEHRFDANAPLYLQVSKDICILHLSEHYGDGSAGITINIEIDDIDAFNQRLLAKQYKYAKPGIEDMPWGSRIMAIRDPFGNKLAFTTETHNS